METDFTANMNELCSASSDKICFLTFFPEADTEGASAPSLLLLILKKNVQQT